MEINPIFDNKHLDQRFTAFLRLISSRFRKTALVLSLAVYTFVMIFFGNILGISSNYFILLPLLAISFVFGFPGGLFAGFLALPLNYLSYSLMGHLEYLPANLYIAEVFGIIVGSFSGYISEFFYRLIDENEKRKATEQQLRETLDEKDLLFRELNHRVKNNLNIIKSLIQLHANRVDDPLFRQECAKLQDRIFSISLVHDQLYPEEQSQDQDIASYLDLLLDNILNSLGDHSIIFTRRWSAVKSYLDRDRTLYLGLIVHEVLMNCMKYASTGDDSLRICIALEDTESGGISLSIADNGPGFDPDIMHSGLGLRLVKTLSCQLNGRIAWQNQKGMIFRLTF